MADETLTSPASPQPQAVREAANAAHDFAPAASAAPVAAVTAAQAPLGVREGRQAFRLVVATLNDDLFDGMVTYVDLPGIAGHIGVLSRHTALLTLLADKPLTLHPVDGPPRTLPVMGGIAEAGPWGVTVLADFAGHDVDAEKRRMDAARERSATRRASPSQGRALPGAAATRARLDDELNLFLIRALRELRR